MSDICEDDWEKGRYVVLRYIFMCRGFAVPLVFAVLDYFKQFQAQLSR